MRGSTNAQRAPTDESNLVHKTGTEDINGFIRFAPVSLQVKTTLTSVSDLSDGWKRGDIQFIAQDGTVVAVIRLQQTGGNSREIIVGLMDRNGGEHWSTLHSINP